MQNLGSKVSLVEFLPNLIPGADGDIVKPLERKLKKQFETIMLGSKVVDIKENKSKILKLPLSDGKTNRMNMKRYS